MSRFITGDALKHLIALAKVRLALEDGGAESKDCESHRKMAARARKIATRTGRLRRGLEDRGADCEDDAAAVKMTAAT